FLNSRSVNRCDRLGGVTISPFTTFHSTPSLAFQPARSLPLKRLIQPSLSSAEMVPIVAHPHASVASSITVQGDFVIVGCSEKSGEVVDQKPLSVDDKIGVELPGLPGKDVPHSPDRLCVAFILISSRRAGANLHLQRAQHFRQCGLFGINAQHV